MPRAPFLCQEGVKYNLHLVHEIFGIPVIAFWLGSCVLLETALKTTILLARQKVMCWRLFEPFAGWFALGCNGLQQPSRASVGDVVGDEMRLAGSVTLASHYRSHFVFVACLMMTTYVTWFTTVHILILELLKGSIQLKFYLFGLERQPTTQVLLFHHFS